MIGAPRVEIEIVWSSMETRLLILLKASVSSAVVLLRGEATCDDDLFETCTCLLTVVKGATDHHDATFGIYQALPVVSVVEGRG